MADKAETTPELQLEVADVVSLDEHDGDFEEFLVGEWSFNEIIAKYLGKRIRLQVSIQTLDGKQETA